ncbi:MAG: 1-(5-phosphoribosyl)-5-amino-4-imidazole-carboxylate carboxylase [Acidobacteria bacterium]|nr:MAG: 1-(5-phosphoribosyl)-5-amino-4-imidazole-carboxylate carboxylase [Acidobacteriota bacterium]
MSGKAKPPPEPSHSKADLGPVADLGYAQVDLQRQQRCGFPEVIFAEGKTCAHLEGVVSQLHLAGQDCLATRVSDEQAAYLERRFPQAEQDRIGRTFWLPAADQSQRQISGKVAVVTAGTADLPVAHEAVATSRALGCEVSLLADVGVAGIHRLLRNLDKIKDADAVIVVAGMEGALPSVVGGLVDCPVVAVPTSVGYGASFQGLAALLCMLNCCAANVTVVNIDSGFKGGYVAGLIARRRHSVDKVTR